jgi:uncharacterized protein YjiS (DUF1127 family)
MRGFAALSAVAARLVDAFVRARRHRAQAAALAGLDSRMLADIGITRADVNDAFSEPFWEDPTALLRERALERRIYRRGVGPTGGTPRRPLTPASDTPFRRPPLDRPARQAI